MAELAEAAKVQYTKAAKKNSRPMDYPIQEAAEEEDTTVHDPAVVALA